MEFNKSVLLFVPEYELRPTGGAAGYNYNLNKGLQEIGAKNYSYLKGSETSRDFFKAMKDSNFKKVLFVAFRFVNYFRLLHKKHGFTRVDLNGFDLIHFHNVKDMYEARDSLAEYTGTVVLTNHSPKPFSSEIYDDVLTPFERRFFGKMYQRLYVMERYAFGRADYIIFPCEYAEEPYYQKWPEYRGIHRRNKDKYRYLLTGTRQVYARMGRSEYRTKVDIPEEAFVISYVGRHNETKGYDHLKNIGITALKDPNTYFLVAGKEAPLTGLNNDHWREVGWTADPYSLINASDIFLLPNAQTYFDLVMLEVLSLGKVVVASNTGGNKFFGTIKAPGIFLYDTEEEALEIIEKLKGFTRAQLNQLGQQNYELYRQRFNNRQFAESYVTLINSLGRGGEQADE